MQGLNQLVSGYLDFAERQAQRQIVMTMADWIQHVDRILLATGENLLTHAGTISREKMTEKVSQEYRKYKAKTLSQVEKDYLAHIKHLEKQLKRERKMTKIEEMIAEHCPNGSNSQGVTV